MDIISIIFGLIGVIAIIFKDYDKCENNIAELLSDASTVKFVKLNGTEIEIESSQLKLLIDKWWLQKIYRSWNNIFKRYILPTIIVTFALFGLSYLFQDFSNDWKVFKELISKIIVVLTIFGFFNWLVMFLNLRKMQNN